MSILLLGKNGQVGDALQNTLAPFGEVIALGRDQLDLVNLDQLSQMLYALSPRIIVNAAAYTAVDNAESESLLCYLINATVVDVLAQYAKAQNALLIHYSTDYVFDGNQTRPYLETDRTNPVNFYGQSKLAGEQIILESQCNALIFRTSWVVSAHGNNFIKTILRLAEMRDTLKVVNDQVGAPTSAAFIAEVTALAIMSQRNKTIDSGLFHLTPSGSTNWYELALRVVERAKYRGFKTKLALDSIKAIPSSEYPLPAKRPSFSCLNTQKLGAALNLDFQNWAVGVDRIVDQLCLASNI